MNNFDFDNRGAGAGEEHKAVQKMTDSCFKCGGGS